MSAKEMNAFVRFIIWFTAIAFIFFFGWFVGDSTADPKPEEYSRNTTYTLYHVEVVNDTYNGIDNKIHSRGNIGYAMVNDEDGSYKIIRLPNICMKNYQPKANVLQVLHCQSGYIGTRARCVWLVEQK